jgi:hypothetical protein
MNTHIFQSAGEVHSQAVVNFPRNTRTHMTPLWRLPIAGRTGSDERAAVGWTSYKVLNRPTPISRALFQSSSGCRLGAMPAYCRFKETVASMRRQKHLGQVGDVSSQRSLFSQRPAGELSVSSLLRTRLDSKAIGPSDHSICTRASHRPALLRTRLTFGFRHPSAVTTPATDRSAHSRSVQGDASKVGRSFRGKLHAS